MNFSCLYFYPRLDLSLISEVPCVKIQVINQFSVFLLRILSLHYSAEIGLHVPGYYLRSNFGHFRDRLRRQDHLRFWDHLRCRTTRT